MRVVGGNSKDNFLNQNQTYSNEEFLLSRISLATPIARLALKLLIFH